MNTLYDILLNAQGGQAMENLARQFHLSQQQTQAAVEALLPAFSMGLKRQASDPATMPNLFGMMGTANPETFFNPMAAFGTQAQQQGNEVLGNLFGSKEVSRAVADQAAALSGIGANVLRAMLPILASILMSGLQKGASAQPGLQDIFGQMMGGMAGGNAGTGPAGNMGNLGDIFGGMFGQAGQQQAQPQRPQVQPNPNGGGLLGAILGSLLQQGVQQSQPAQPQSQAAQPQPRPEPKPDPDTSRPQSPDVFGQMFETGRQMQQAHLESLEQIFNAMLGKK